MRQPTSMGRDGRRDETPMGRVVPAAPIGLTPEDVRIGHLSARAAACLTPVDDGWGLILRGVELCALSQPRPLQVELYDGAHGDSEEFDPALFAKLCGESGYGRYTGAGTGDHLVSP